MMISNGYIKEEPLIQLCEQLNGVKVDLKSFSEKFYKEYCNGELKPVLATLKRLQKIGIWYELVVLINKEATEDGTVIIIAALLVSMLLTAIV